MTSVEWLFFHFLCILQCVSDLFTLWFDKFDICQTITFSIICSTQALTPNVRAPTQYSLNCCVGKLCYFIDKLQNCVLIFNTNNAIRLRNQTRYRKLGTGKVATLIDTDCHKLERNLTVAYFVKTIETGAFGN